MRLKNGISYGIGSRLWMGLLIMETFNIPPSRTVGLIKNEIREAILEGDIPNNKEAALAFMHEIAPKYLSKEGE